MLVLSTRMSPCSLNIKSLYEKTSLRVGIVAPLIYDELVGTRPTSSYLMGLYWKRRVGSLLLTGVRCSQLSTTTQMNAL